MSAVVPPPEYYPMVREICDEFDMLFIVDEVMSGVGRTGRKWGIEHWGVTPDIITTAKGISGGYSPLGATLLAEKVWQAMAQGSKSVMHSYTYGGNPVSCAAGTATLKYIEEHHLIERAGQMGESLFARLEELKEELPYIGDVRGKGLFLGIELVRDRSTKEPFPHDWQVGEKIEEQALDNGLLVLAGVEGLLDGVGGDHLELVPPYTIEENHLSMIVDLLHKSISQVIDRMPL
jgi:adenosylmethionine-8-amino-7-oxononanoate aminotransferase